MNALSVQSLGMGQPQTDDPVFGLNLRPDFGSGIPLLPDRKRRRPEKGEAYRAEDATRPSRPYTPSSDERNLPSSVTGRRLLQIRHRDFQRSFPHTRVDYEDARVSLGPDMGPTPSGWAPAPSFDWERERALQAAMPQPWSSPEDMATDINGFGSMHEAFMGALPGMVVSLDDPPAQAATQTVAAEAAAAQAAGAGPGIVEQIISVGSTAAAIYLQQQQIEAAKKQTELQQRLLAAQASAARAPASVVAAVTPGPGIGTYAAIGGGVLALAAVIYFATRKGGRR